MFVLGGILVLLISVPVFAEINQLKIPNGFDINEVVEQNDSDNPGIIIRVNEKGGDIVVDGIWGAYGTFALIIPVSESGNVLISARNLDGLITASFTKNEKGQPQLKNVDCRVDISNFDLEISGGGFIGWIMNMFRKLVENKIRPVLENKICAEARYFLNKDVNDRLKTMKTQVELSKYFNLDYSLKSDPFVNYKFVEVGLKGEIKPKSIKLTPFYPSLMHSNYSDIHMLDLFISDYVINSYLYHAHNFDLIDFDLNSQAFPAFQEYLQFHCPELLCIGSFLPELSLMYADSSASFNLKSSKSPFLVFKNGKGTLSGFFTLKFFSKNDSDYEELICEGNLFLTAYLEPIFNSSSRILSGSIQIPDLMFKITYLPVKELDGISLDLLLDIAGPVLEELANDYLRKGIELPMLDRVTLTNSNLSVVHRALRLSTDFDLL